eukprot:12880798-Prorocentrum_lima.AAC.1
MGQSWQPCAALLLAPSSAGSSTWHPRSGGPLQRDWPQTGAMVALLPPHPLVDPFISCSLSLSS